MSDGPYELRPGRLDPSTPWTPKPTTVLGWRSPWSGDENDPIPWTYRLWVRAHWADMRLRHRLGLHAWRTRPLGGEHCDWCGANRHTPAPSTANPQPTPGTARGEEER